MKDIFLKHEIVNKNPSRVWEDGFPIGNGKFGAMVYEPGYFEWGISKLDVWDRRIDKNHKLTSHKQILQLLKNKDFQKLEEIRVKERFSWANYPYPCPKPCGFLRIKDSNGANIFEREKNLNFERILSIHKATVETYLKDKNREINITSFVHPWSDVLVIKCDLKNKSAKDFLIELYRETDASFCTIPESGHNDKYFWIKYKFPDGLEYAMVTRITGINHIKEIEYPNNLNFSYTGYAKVKANTDPVKSREFTIYLSVVTNIDSKNPFEKAKMQINRAVTSGYNQIYREHTEWWGKFWSKSSINISDKTIEGLWYFYLYQLTSTTREEPVPGLAGLWNLYDNPPWHGAYTDLNEPMIYYPIFTANHSELGKPYYETFYKMLSAIKKETKQLYGIDGAKYPHQMAPDGIELGYTFIRYAQSTSALYAQIYWWHYLYTQDKKFLKERCYPVLKEVTTYYQGYIKKDPKGKYYVYPTYSLEQGKPWVKNVCMDLAMIKVILKAVIKSSEILCVDETERKRWQVILKNMSDYPEYKGIYTDYEGIKPDDHMINHAGPIAVVFPSGEISIGNKDYNKAKKTFGITCKMTKPNIAFAWTNLACVSARLGLGEKTKRILHKKVISNFLMVNKFLTLSLSERKLILLEVCSSFVTAVNEMLLQSHNGLIRVFPAVPRDWNAKIENLRAVGAFLVSSEIKNNDVKYISIKSLAGCKCSVVTQWKGQKVTVCHSESTCGNLNDRILRFAQNERKNEIISVTKNNIVTFDTVKNNIYILYAGNYLKFEFRISAFNRNSIIVEQIPLFRKTRNRIDFRRINI